VRTTLVVAVGGKVEGDGPWKTDLVRQLRWRCRGGGLSSGRGVSDG
jgi:hypothetical protein